MVAIRASASSSAYITPDSLFEQLPGLQSLSLREMGDATGLSIDYYSKIKRGLKIPHPSHWTVLADLTMVERKSGWVLE